MYELVPRPGCEPWLRMYAASSGGKSSVLPSRDWRTGILSPIESIWISVATQLSGTGVGVGVGSGVGRGVAPGSEGASCVGDGVASATGEDGSGIGSRLGAAG